MRLPLHQVDAFTQRLFAGNPAAVVVLDAWLPDPTLAAIAAENNLSETAFVIPAPDPKPLRWFTPTVEMDLCGHATLGAAWVLFRHYLPALHRLRFATRSGELTVVRDGTRLAMELPARPGTPVPMDQAVIAALGDRPRQALRARDLLVVFDSEAQVRGLRPDFARLAALDAPAVIASAPGDDADFVSRFFAPKLGIPEDPVTGSAHSTLVPYWAARLGKTRLFARQVSSRGGELHCTLKADCVEMSGDVVEYLRGEIEVDVDPENA